MLTTLDADATVMEIFKRVFSTPIEKGVLRYPFSCKEKKEMINAYSLNVPIASTELIPFTTVNVQKGDTVKLTGTTALQFNKQGIYEIHFDVSALPTSAGDVVISTLKNGAEYLGASANVEDAVTTLGVHLNITTLVQVPMTNTKCCCTSPTIIQFINSGVALTRANVNVTVTKVC